MFYLFRLVSVLFDLFIYVFIYLGRLVSLFSYLSIYFSYLAKYLFGYYFFNFNLYLCFVLVNYLFS